MRWYVIAIFAYVFAALESSVFTPGLLAFKIYRAAAQPDLLLVTAVFAALTVERWEDAFIAGWCLGLVEDLLSGTRLGVTATGLGLVASGIYVLRSGLMYGQPLVQAVLVFVAVLVVRPVQQLILYHLSGSSSGVGLALEQGAVDAAYTALVAPVVLWLLAKTASRRGTLSGRPG